MPESADLDQTALAVYRDILLEHDSAPATIARRLEIPEQNVRRVIGNLLELGLLTESWTDPEGVRAVSPDTGIQILTERERHRAAQRQHLLEQCRADLASFAAEYSGRSQHGPLGTESILGADAIRVRLESFVESASVEICSFQAEAEIAEKALAAGRVTNRRCLERGVRLRSVFLSSSVHQRSIREHMRIMTPLGAEMRVTPTLPIRLLLVDQKAAVLPAPPVDGKQRIVVMNFPPFVEALVALFESYWQRARAVGGTQQTLPGELSDQEREILHQLACGATDDAVARALGIGVRTERRIVADLMDRLGASSRFEAGVKAARQGLI